MQLYVLEIERFIFFLFLFESIVSLHFFFFDYLLKFFFLLLVEWFLLLILFQKLFKM